jgi:hypothetical protein
MKKILFILLSISLFSCKKEEVKPNPTPSVEVIDEIYYGASTVKNDPYKDLTKVEVTLRNNGKVPCKIKINYTLYVDYKIVGYTQLIIANNRTINPGEITYDEVYIKSPFTIMGKYRELGREIILE